MSAERWLRLRELYDALSHAPAGDRNQLLNDLCADPDLRTEVLALLAANDAPDPFLAGAPLSASAHSSLLPGAVLCDRFEIHRLIGQGGMGEVWAARDRQLEEDIAIKTIRSSMVNEAGGVARFKREIQLARRIGHPNVCRVHELFEDTSVTPSRLFLTMELLEGETLAARLRNGGPLSTGAALDIFRQITAGLAAAHDAGVIHRDLKPANIMITSGPAGGRVVLMDFGLARGPDKEQPSGATQVGALIGTPEYMAPEQISGAAPTPATDIYALGLILFEMLRGKPPFAADSTLESWMRRAREGPERLSGVVPGVQARIDSVIARCLEYEPAKRFQSAGQVWDALQSPWTAVATRSRIPLAGTAAILVLALVGIGAWNLIDRFRGTAAPPPEAVQWYEEAQRALAEGASVRAMNDINRAIELAPRFAAAHVALAEILLELDMPGRAQEAMLKATELAPDRSRLDADHAAYLEGIQQLMLRNCDAAISSLQRVADSVADVDRPYRLISIARAMERCGETDKALATLAEVTRLDPRNAAAFLRQARLLAQRREYQAAETALATAEGLFRDRSNQQGVAEVLVARATFQTQREQLDEADETLTKASDLARSIDDVRQQIRVLLQQATVLRNRGKLTEARGLTTEAIELATRHNLESLTLGGLIAAASTHVSGRQLNEAIELFETTLRLAQAYRHDDYRAWAHLGLATAYAQMPEPDKVQKAIEVARPHLERTGQVRNVVTSDVLLGQMSIVRGQYQQAVTQFSAALEAAQKVKDIDQEVRARENLATAWTAIGRYVDALNEYTRVVDIRRAGGRKQAEAFALLNVADLLSRMGRFEDATAVIVTVNGLVSDSRDLQSRQRLVAAELELRRGNHGEAARLAALVRRSDLPAERFTRSLQVTCLADATLGRRSSALDACEQMLAQRSDSLVLRGETHLTASEANLLLGNAPRAMELAREAAAFFQGIPEYHERWKVIALLIASGATDVSTELLTQELVRLRLSWGDDTFEHWRRRSDVRRLVPLEIHSTARSDRPGPTE